MEEGAGEDTTHHKTGKTEKSRRKFHLYMHAEVGVGGGGEVTTHPQDRERGGGEVGEVTTHPQDREGGGGGGGR